MKQVLGALTLRRLLGLIGLLLLCTGARADTLVWDPNTEPDLAGYKVYIAAGAVTNVVDVGPVASYSLSSLAAGTTYTIFVTAYNSAALESNPSAPLTYTPSGSSVVAPTITSQPSNVTVVAGSPASLTVQASGTAPLTYQWSKNGTAIFGATSATYSIASAASADAGSYTVAVGNSAGTVTSSAATITVQPAPIPPSITSQPSNVTVVAGSPASLSVQASGTAPLSYQWFKGASAISGATSATFSIASAASADAGSYTVRVTNIAGTVTSSAVTITVQVPPAITTQPSNVTVVAGSSASLSVQASGTAPLSYQWLKAGVPISGATSATYSIASATSADAGSYTVTVTNVAGNVTSSAATITVRVPPSITTQPSNVTVVAGSPFSLTVQASGTAPLSYQWFKGGTSIAGATSATYSVASAVANSAGSYTVRVTNIAGNVTSTAAIVTVQTPPTITTQPANLSLVTGTSGSLTVQAAGTAPLSYQWSKGGVAIAGATSSSYTISSASAGDAGSYTVRVSNSIGNVTSSAATVTVQAAPTAPSITTPPADITLVAGTSGSLSVQVSGTAPLSYQWFKNGATITGATASTYSIASATPADAGSYTVRVSNSVGNVTSAAAIVTVQSPPTITVQPSDVTLVSGTAGSLAVQATGTAPLSYQWFKDGTALSGATLASYAISSASANDAGTYTVLVSNVAGNVTSSPAVVTVQPAPTPPTITGQPTSISLVAGTSGSLTVQASGTAPLSYQWLKNGATISGATASTYVIASAASADAGSYTVRVSNSLGTVTSSAATVTVQVPPTITVQPTSISLTIGAAGSLSVQAGGTAPLSYQWFKNGSALSGATSATYTIASAANGNAGSYTVRVSNSAGNVTSSAATVTVQAAPTPPSITTQPVGVTVTDGSSINLSVQAAGSAPLLYQWSKNGAVIPGAVNPTYTVAAATANDAGSYTVEVSNSLGTITSSPAIVTVQAAVSAPVIVFQPLDTTVTAGSVATLAVQVSGTAPLSYQWFKDGVTLAGQINATLTVPFATAPDSGSYTVRITNPAGSVTSNPAILTVSSAISPIIVAPLTDVTVNLGSSFSLTVQVSGAAPLSYQWYKNGVAISGAVNGTYSVPVATSANAGNYTVRVSNSAGSITSNPATVTVFDPAPLSILSSPRDTTVNEGDMASLTVTADGEGPFSYQWLKNGSNMVGMISSTLGFFSTQLEDDASYSVIVSNARGSVTSDSAHLTVLGAPKIVTQPLATNVNVGTAAALEIVALGSGPLQYQWYKNGAAVAGATSPVLNLSSAAFADAGTYTITISNPLGTVTSRPMNLTVVLAPRLVSQPISTTVRDGVSFNLSVSATSDGPMTFQWYKDGLAIPGALASTLSFAPAREADTGVYTVVVANSSGSVTTSPANIVVLAAPRIITAPQSQTVYEDSPLALSVEYAGNGALAFQWYKNNMLLPNQTGASLLIPAAKPADEGSYTVRISNAAGNVTSAAAVVTIFGKPTIVQSPSSKSVNIGDSVFLTVQASGSGNLTFQWFKSGVPIDGATSVYLIVTVTDSSSFGSYSVTVSNDAGSVESAAAVISTASDPEAASGKLSISSADAGSPLQIQAKGVPGQTYDIQVSSNLSAGSWITIRTVTVGPAGTFVIDLSTASQNQYLFVRTVRR